MASVFALHRRQHLIGKASFTTRSAAPRFGLPLVCRPWTTRPRPFCTTRRAMRAPVRLKPIIANCICFPLVLRVAHIACQTRIASDSHVCLGTPRPRRLGMLLARPWSVCAPQHVAERQSLEAPKRSFPVCPSPCSKPTRDVALQHSSCSMYATEQTHRVPNRTVCAVEIIAHAQCRRAQRHRRNFQ